MSLINLWILTAIVTVYWLTQKISAITENGMARLDQMAPAQREVLESLDCPTIADTAFVPPRPLNQCRVALVSSAGLMKRKDDNVSGSSSDYRVFENSWPERDILMNHISVNFDRTAFAEDINVVFPRAILKEMAEQEVIERTAAKHYAFMGATAPDKLQENVERLASELIDANINTVCLLPV